MPDDPKPEPGKEDPKPDPETDWKAEAEKWQSLSKKNEQTAKANADAAKRLKDLEDAGRSESEKLTAKATEAEKRATDAESRALRLEVAADKGLTPAQAKRLVGSTREELIADADELLATFSAGKPKPKPTDRPRESLRGGGDPTEEPEESDPRKLAAQVPRM